MNSRKLDEPTNEKKELISLPAKLFEHAQIRSNNVAIRHKKFGIRREFTWGEYFDIVKSVSFGLYAVTYTHLTLPTIYSV